MMIVAIMHTQKYFRHTNLKITNKCIYEITEYICRHTMRSSNKHLRFIIIIIIIDDASTVTAVIFHQLQGLGTILLSQHPAACKPTENKSIWQLDRKKTNTSHTLFPKMEHQLCTATMWKMCSEAGFMSTGQAQSLSLQFTRFHTLQLFLMEFCQQSIVWVYCARGQKSRSLYCNINRNVPTCLFSAGDCRALKSVSRPDWYVGPPQRAM